MEFDRTKTLQELENVDWGVARCGSNLMTTCYELRQKPLEEFSVEDLRIMIGQKVGLRFLIPLAIEHLSVDPLVEGDFGRGDLMQNVLRVPSEFWNDNSQFWWAVHEIVVEMENIRDTIKNEIMPAAKAFRTMNPDLHTDQT
jgi:hypothetical protein